MLKLLIILHLLGACIWVGGHLLLTLRFLPESLKKKDPSIIAEFERQYEPVGITALILQVVTGLWITTTYKLNCFSMSNNMEKVIVIKLTLLLITVLLALHARFFIIPKLSKDNLNLLAIHIISVTVVGVLMLYFGVAYRYGI